MKKMLILLAALTLTAGTVSAQTEMARPGRGAQLDRTPAQQADMLAKRLTRELALSADQTDKVRQISLASASAMQALRGKYAAGGSRQGMGPEMKALRDQNDAQLKAVLSADQYRTYDQLRDDQVEKRRDKMKSGKRQGKTQS
ncbi:hypothetical protein GCM10022408_15290 [Hymenobacter fastidiosus]|uniref:DUF4890 domain-containing protein n=1 Tax=Hymenobacter fastidiosus TaxID=486264 RepID=A0ABP7RZH2_9BACT